MRTRIVPLPKGKNSIQVVSKRHDKLTVHKHIGTYSNERERIKLLRKAAIYIEETTGQTNLLNYGKATPLSDIEIIGSKRLFLYKLLERVYTKIGFGDCEDELIKDLVIARVYKPASKLHTQEVLKKEFGKHYGLATIYRRLRKIHKHNIKETFQESLIAFAKNGLNDTLKLIFYDVTTLYFESDIKEGLRDVGFSKDHHPQDTQVVIGLVVNKDGFPLYFDVFNGKTFEGNTFLPIILGIQKKLNQPKLVVVADAAMISRNNIELLVKNHIQFIVAARTSNLPKELIESISKTLNQEDDKSIEIAHQNHRLVCHYSKKRAAKDKSDRLKQIAKAEKSISDPTSLTRRYRFIKSSGKAYRLNSELIAKAEKLEGIKSYLTNTSLNRKMVIHRYRDLWNIENSFRITKSDLKARPIFHRLDDAIKTHLVIVFAALAISKFIELFSGLSIQKVLLIAEQVLSHNARNTISGETSIINTSIQDPVLIEYIHLLNSVGH
jgi:transposase